MKNILQVCCLRLALNLCVDGPFLHTASLGLELCDPQVDDSQSCADELRLSFSDLYAHLGAQRMAIPTGIHD